MGKSKFSNLTSSLKPREKFEMFGGESLNDIELLAIVLQTGSKNKSVNLLAMELIEKYGNLSKLMAQPIYKLINENVGIGTAKAIKIKTIFYMAQRLESEQSIKIKVTNAYDIYKVVKVYENNPEENFYIVGLSNNNEIIGVKHLFKGSIDNVSISFREIFKEALMMNSKNICLIHNHPSGNVTPSLNDIKMTELVINSSKYLGVGVIDHIVIGGNEYFSFKEKELIEFL